MHDIADLERRGVPGVFIASDVFVDAAAVQAEAIGFPAAARVFVPHPIQDRTDDEVVALAEAAVEAVLARITGEGGTESP